MFNKKLFFVLLITVLLAGCQSSQVQDLKETEDVSQAEKESDNKDFAEMRPGVINLDELTVVFSRHDFQLDFRKSFYASEAQVFTALYEGLFSYHPMSLDPVPALAERWEISEDKMQWAFTIRRDARFSNGDPVRAEDFRAAWLSMLEPNRQAPYSSFFDIIEGAHDYRIGKEKNPERVGITASSERTLIVKLNSPASFFPAMLCHHSFSAIHPSMLNRDNWSLPLPVSNGPFQIASINDDKIVMQKSDHYWDRNRVALKNIIIKFTDTGDEASNLWNSGEARWISGNVNLESLKDRSGIQMNVMFATHYYYIRAHEKPWNDHRVRRAMALALPWQEIRSIYLLPAETLIFPVAGYPEVKGISEPDYEEAKKLMAEAGYENGVGLPELVIRLTPSNDAARVGGLMAAAWKEKLGFNVRIEVHSFEDYFQSLKDANYTVGSITWIGDFADPYAFLKMYMSDSNLNDPRLDDRDYETLIERSMIEEGKTRLETLAEAEKLLLERGVILPICYNPALNIVDMGELDGWYPNALDIHPFKYMSFKTLRPLPGVALLSDGLKRVKKDEA